jgi:hypothetical protein
MHNSISILKYSGKCCVVTGDTKPIKDLLKQQGGKFNAHLTHPVTSAPLMGWVFSLARQNALEHILIANGVHFDRVTPSNFNDQTASHFMPCPSEIAPDFAKSDNT